MRRRSRFGIVIAATTACALFAWAYISDDLRLAPGTSAIESDERIGNRVAAQQPPILPETGTRSRWASSWEVLLAEATPTIESKSGGKARDSLTALRRLVKDDPAVRAELMRHYTVHPDGPAKSVVRQLLLHAATADVVDFSWELAASNDPAQRRDAYDLLARLPATPDIAARASGALAREQDKDVLTGIIRMLGRPSVVGTSQSNEVISQLVNLNRHQEPSVRAASLLTLAKWDGAGATVDESAYRSISDAAPGVRQAAIGAIAIGQLRSERIKTALARITRDANGDPQVRFSASQALGQFPLSAVERTANDRIIAEIKSLVPNKK